MVQHLYTPTTYKTRVDLLPEEIERGKIEDYLLARLKDEYENRTIKDGNVMGFIRKGSLKLVERSRGFMMGSHFTGILTFHVVVNFDLYTPILNKTVEATVMKMTQIGFTADSHPLRIIVAKTTTFEQANDLFDNIKPGLQIPIEILHYELRGTHIYAVGRLRQFEENYAKSYEINIPGDLPAKNFDTLQTPETLVYTTTVPKQNEAYGDPSKLNEAKDALSDPITRAYWDHYMKQFLNDYEIIGNTSYFPTNQVFSLSPMPFNRAYYKLLEMLKDEQVLQDFEDEPINALLLGEAPGGFIQALIDSRQNPQDRLTAVTAPRNPKKGVELDWQHNQSAARSYLDKQKNLSLLNLDLTNPKHIVEIISRFAVGDSESQKAQIITADGGIDVETNDNYNFQERMNYKLFYGEILTAIASQAVGGHYIMKIYDIYTDVTYQFIHLLANLYETVTVTKPKTSRPANSERYLVCKGFRGLHNFPLKEHLNQLSRWNEEEDLRNIDVLTPFLNRGFYITSLITIHPNPGTIALISEKNDLFVRRQLLSLEKGMKILNDLRGNVIPEQEKVEIVSEQMTKQIQNALMWCKEYLPANSCKPMPPVNTNYYRTSQDNLEPLLPMVRGSRSYHESRSSSSSREGRGRGR